MATKKQLILPGSGIDLFDLAGSFKRKQDAAAAALVPPPPPIDPVAAAAGDNTTKYAAEQAAATRQAASGFGSVADDGNDADTLGRPNGGVKRRAAARALLG